MCPSAPVHYRLLSFFWALSGAMAFTFNVSQPTQCGEMLVKWDGGSAPYEILIVPTTEVPNGKLVSIDVPSSAESAREYRFYMPEPAGLGVLMTMSDSSGFGTGGSTPVLNIESSSNSSCLNGEPPLAFTFYLTPSTPSQCSPLQINWPANATSPELHGMIPGGSAWTIPTGPGGGQQTSWNTNVAQGTEMLLLMTASTGFGGSTNLLTVGGGGEGCIDGSSPSSASSGSGTTMLSLNDDSGGNGGSGGSGNGGGNGGNGGGSGGEGGGSGSKTGAIVGGTLGGVAFIVLLAILLLCFCRRKVKDRRRSSTHSTLVGYGFGRKSGDREKPNVDLVEEGAAARPSGSGFSLADGQRPNSIPQAPFSVDGSSNGNGNGTPPQQTSAYASSEVAGQGYAGQREEGEGYRPSPFVYDAAPGASEVGTNGHGSGLPAGAAAATGVGAGLAGAAAAAHGRDEKRQSRGRFYMVSEPDAPRQTAYGSSNAAPSESAVGTQGHGIQQGPQEEVKDSREAAHDEAMEARQPARFVQHEDAGVIDLPPRYDQLRGGPPA